MNITITGKDVKATEAIKEYVEKKLTRIGKYYEASNVDVNVTIKKENVQSEIAEMFVITKGTSYKAVTEDKDGKKSKLLGIPFSAKYVGEELSGFIETIPTLLYIREGKIEYLIEGSVPNVYIFRSLYLNQADSVILNKYY